MKNICLAAARKMLIGMMLCFMVPGIMLNAQEADSLRSLIDNLPDGIEKVDKYTELFKMYYYAYHYDSAIAYCNRSAELAGELGYEQGLAEAYYWLSVNNKFLPDLAKAQHFIEKYLDVVYRLKDTVSLGKGYYMQAIMYFENSKLEMALISVRRSLSFFQSIGEDRYLPMIMNNMGSIFKEKSQFDSAAVYFLKGIEICEEREDLGTLSSLFDNLGDTYHMSENYDAARRYYEKARELNLQLENRESWLGINCVNLGRLAADEKKFLEAIRYYDEAAVYFQQANRNQDLYNLYNNYGDVFYEQGKYQLALEYFDKALRGYVEIDWLKGVVTAMRNKAIAYHQSGDLRSASLLLDSVHLLIVEEGSLEMLTQVLGNKADLYRDMGDTEKAFEYLELQSHIKDSLYILYRTEVTQDLLLKYEKEQDLARIVSLENENLKKDLQLGQRTTQRNAILSAGVVIIALAVFIILFFRQKAIKDRIIARQKIQQLEEEKKLMAAKLLVEGQEKERKRIARELHDGLGVLLSATRMQFTSIKDTSPENKPLIEKATQMLEQAAGDVRKISHNMMPGLLTKMGFIEAVEDLFENLNDMEDLEAKCEVHGEMKERLPENKEIMLYRIIQELVNNTLKHAEAKNISIVVKVFPGQLHIKYADDGKGFKVKETLASETGSLGLKSVESRMGFLNGDMDIQSGPGNGAHFMLQVPI